MRCLIKGAFIEDSLGTTLLETLTKAEELASAAPPAALPEVLSSQSDAKAQTETEEVEASPVTENDPLIVENLSFGESVCSIGSAIREKKSKENSKTKTKPSHKRRKLMATAYLSSSAENDDDYGLYKACLVCDKLAMGLHVTFRDVDLSAMYILHSAWATRCEASRNVEPAAAAMAAFLLSCKSWSDFIRVPALKDIVECYMKFVDSDETLRIDLPRDDKQRPALRAAAIKFEADCLMAVEYDFKFRHLCGQGAKIDNIALKFNWPEASYKDAIISASRATTSLPLRFSHLLLIDSATALCTGLLWIATENGISREEQGTKLLEWEKLLQVKKVSIKNVVNTYMEYQNNVLPAMATRIESEREEKQAKAKAKQKILDAQLATLTFPNAPGDQQQLASAQSQIYAPSAGYMPPTALSCASSAASFNPHLVESDNKNSVSMDPRNKKKKAKLRAELEEGECDEGSPHGDTDAESVRDVSTEEWRTKSAAHKNVLIQQAQIDDLICDVCNCSIIMPPRVW